MIRRAMIAGAAALLILCAQAGRAAAAECPNEELRVEKSAGLPDCRAYEQVSPSVKGTDVGVFGPRSFPEPFVSLASQTQDGSVMFASHEPLPNSVSGTLTNLYRGERGADGWVNRPIVPAVSPAPGSLSIPGYYATSPDLSKTVFQSSNPSLASGAELNVLNTYLGDNETESYSLLTTNQATEGNRGTTAFVGGSKDFSHIAFGYNARLLPEAPEGPAVYEFVNGTLRLASILPNGEPSPTGGPVGATSNRGIHAVSDDGSHVYFDGIIPGAENTNNGIYVRIDGDRTVRVDASKRAVPVFNNLLPSGFWAASSNGNLSFFTSQLPLTEDANTGRDSEGNFILTGQDLYMYDLSQEKLTDLSVDSNPLDAESGAEVQGVVGTSEDGSYAYFVALGALEPGATKGSPNLYVWHNGTVRYLATLAASDSGDWAGFIQTITSRVSPDGHHVLLSSAASLTGYDNTDAVTGEPDSEIYLYSAGPSSFECVSCNPDGSQPRSSTSLFTFLYNTSELLPDFMSDDGSRIAFETSESLVRGDTNGQPDIYEFSNGKVALISSGTDSRGSGFGAMSADGKDLYFTTYERLTRSDIDDYADLYDARGGGGFPETRPNTACAGSECPRDISTSPAASPGGTESFEGPPNPVGKPKTKKPRCGPKRRAVKKGGRYKCVAKAPKKAIDKATKHGKNRRAAGANKGGSK